MLRFKCHQAQFQPPGWQSLGFCLFLALLPFVARLNAVHDRELFAQVGLQFICAAVLWRRQLNVSLVLLPWLGFLIIVNLQYFLNSPMCSLNYSKYLIYIIGLLAFFIATQIGLGAFHIWRFSVLVGGVGMSAYAILFKIGLFHRDGLYWVGFFGDKNKLGLFLVMAFGVAMALRPVKLRAFLMALFFAGAYLAGSKGGCLAMVLMSVALVWLCWGRMAAIIVLFFIAITIICTPNRLFQETERYYKKLMVKKYDRMVIYKNSVRLYAARPVAGAGVGGAAIVSGNDFSGPHNIFLVFLVSGGPLLLLAFLAVCGVALVPAFRRREWDIFLPAVGFLFYSFFDDMWQWAPDYVFFWALLGLASARNLSWWPVPISRLPAVAASVCFPVVGVIVARLWLGNVLFTHVPDVQNDPPAMERLCGEVLRYNPRHYRAVYIRGVCRLNRGDMGGLADIKQVAGWIPGYMETDKILGGFKCQR